MILCQCVLRESNNFSFVICLTSSLHITTISRPLNSCRWHRKLSRTRRLIRFRSTAFFNTRLLIAIPSRASLSLFGQASKVHLLSDERLDLSRNTAWKSRLFRSRAWRGNVNPSLIKTVVNSGCVVACTTTSASSQISLDHTIKSSGENSLFNNR